MTDADLSLRHVFYGNAIFTAGRGIDAVPSCYTGEPPYRQMH